MKKRVLFLLCLIFLAACTTIHSSEESVQEEYEDEVEEEFLPENHEEAEEEFKEPIIENNFRLEIPTESERESLPDCSGLLFTTFPQDMNDVTAITPLGNLGPPGHTFPTDHPHLHVGEHGSEASFDVVAPADVYLTMVSWSDGVSNDPRDYTVYFALCKDVIAYYNHVKTVSPELQNILDEVECESFSDGVESCTKVIDLDFIEEGTTLGTVGLKQGNWDFGLIDLSKELNFVNFERYAERSRYIQCPFDYYPEDMKAMFYSLIERDDGECSTTMQDVAGTLKGNWFHETAAATEVVDWNVHLAFVEDYEFSEAQVVSIAGIFTEPSKFEFFPKDSGNINRDFAQVTPGGIYCYQTEDIGKYQLGASGKVVVEMLDEETLQIEYQSGSCTGSETISNPEIYER